MDKSVQNSSLLVYATRTEDETLLHIVVDGRQVIEPITRNQMLNMMEVFLKSLGD